MSVCIYMLYAHLCVCIDTRVCTEVLRHVCPCGDPHWVSASTACHLTFDHNSIKFVPWWFLTCKWYVLVTLIDFLWPPSHHPQSAFPVSPSSLLRQAFSPSRQYAVYPLSNSGLADQSAHQPLWSAHLCPQTLGYRCAQHAQLSCGQWGVQSLHSKHFALGAIPSPDIFLVCNGSWSQTSETIPFASYSLLYLVL